MTDQCRILGCPSKHSTTIAAVVEHPLDRQLVEVIVPVCATHKELIAMGNDLAVSMSNPTT